MRKTTFAKADYDEFIAKFIQLLQLHGINLKFTDRAGWEELNKDSSDPSPLIDFTLTSKEYVSGYLAQMAANQVLDCFNAKSYVWYLIEVNVPQYKDNYYTQKFIMGAM